MDLAQRNTRLELSYGLGHNTVGRTADAAFEELLLTHNAQAFISQVVNRRTIAGLSYTLRIADGWQSSPYRYVTTTGPVTSSLERHPDFRLRHAVRLDGLHLLFDDVALFGAYRFYGDSWGVLAHTLTVELRVALTEELTGRVRGRGYYQGAASFWRETYREPLQFMSADRELSTFWDAGGGFKLAWEPGQWIVDVKAEGQYYRFADFARLKDRLVFMTEVGFGVKW